jgi:hypothetical protein
MYYAEKEVYKPAPSLLSYSPLQYRRAFNKYLLIKKLDFEDDMCKTTSTKKYYRLGTCGKKVRSSGGSRQ